MALTRRLDPDVVLMDVQMPVMNGIEATREIVALGREDSSRVVILTTFDLDEYVYEALKAGASGFLLKRTPAEDLVAGIRVVAEGEALLAPSVTQRLIENFRSRPESTPSRDASELDDLTEREREVLVLVARGMTNGDIAAHLFLERGHGQDAREAHLRQARPARPHPGRDPRLRGRAGAAGRGRPGRMS